MLNSMYLGALIEIELTSASVGEMLTAIGRAGIQLKDVHNSDELTVRCCISATDYNLLYSLLIRRGERVRIIKKKGVYWTCGQIIKRPVIFFALLILFGISIVLPTRVLFVRVEGNSLISKEHIIDEAEKCGISFGASRRKVRSEKMKNLLLESIPELQWAGINTNGCTAVITVKERKEIDIDNTKKPIGVKSVIAAKDGVIQDVTVLRGNQLCKEGEAVKKGQVLISGYSDCGLSVKATGADGEIYALTRYDVDALIPLLTKKRDEKVSIKNRCYLQIGKKLINLSQDSGIPDSTCVKIYKRSFITLPGGFCLPVALVTEQYIFYDYQQITMQSGRSCKWARNYIDDYLISQMVAGQILRANYNADYMPGACILSGSALCTEMIGRTQTEEIILYNGKNS